MTARPAACERPGDQHQPPVRLYPSGRLCALHAPKPKRAPD